MVTVLVCLGVKSNNVPAVLSVVQKQSSRQAPVRVTVYDAVGIGAGGSGAAAGLLHPFAPTGKVLWRAQEAMEAALELLAAAEAAAEQDPGERLCKLM